MSVTMIGLDVAKSVFQLHGIDASGSVQLRRKLRRDELDGALAEGDRRQGVFLDRPSCPTCTACEAIRIAWMSASVSAGAAKTPCM